MTIRNNGAACSSWRVTIPFNQSISVVNGWNASFEASGTSLLARSMSYNGSIAAGGVVSGIGFQVVAGSNLAPKGSSGPSLTYRTHVQTYGWQKYVSAGKMSGTSGKSKRLEGINIRLANAPCGGTIQYRTHVQRLGWQGWRNNGAMAGTSGRSLRLEAIEIRLTGELANRYDIYYRVHCQRFGWMGWAKNGARSGSAGYSRRLEGIQIVLVRRGSKAPGQSYGGIRQNVSRAFAQRK
jgi:transglutaminase/protease-like cytokinesis protein 3